VALAELAERPFILPEPGSGLREAVVAACQRAGFSPIPLFEVSDPLTVRHLVHDGLGVGVAPAAWFESPGPAVAASPLRDEALRHRVGALTPAAGVAPAAELLLAALREALERPVEL
jgi:DNA-binding transcriptional LysR family regulator